MCISAKEAAEEMDAMGDYCEKCRTAEVVDFQSRAGLHRAFMPESGSGRVWIDFLTFWQVKRSLINWGPAFGLLLLLASGAAVVYGAASLINWEHALMLLGMSR